VLPLHSVFKAAPLRPASRLLALALTTFLFGGIGGTDARSANPAPSQTKTASPAARAPVIWTVDQLANIGGHAPTVLGEPKAEEIDGVRGLRFDGLDDGLFVPDNPIAGLPVFTIEILFRPESGGLAEQRFLHIQDVSSVDARALIETRLENGTWYLDTHVRTHEARKQTLVDPTKTHPTARWYWAALSFDGKTMAHFVNAVRECEAPLEFEPLAAGRTSLGVRQNKVYWFKGAIAEVRFHSEALPAEKLQRVPTR
jgi:hypothetical protein